MEVARVGGRVATYQCDVLGGDGGSVGCGGLVEGALDGEALRMSAEGVIRLMSVPIRALRII